MSYTVRISNVNTGEYQDHVYNDETAAMASIGAVATYQALDGPTYFVAEILDPDLVSEWTPRLVP